MVSTFNRLKEQCCRCKHSEFEYVVSIITGWINCKKLKKHNLQLKEEISICPLYEYAARLEQRRVYYDIIKGECGLKNKEDNVFLKFNTVFFEAIVDGSKTATTRTKDKNLQVNDVITAQFVDSDGEIIKVQELPLKIMGVEKIKYNDLTHHHAFKEGYLHKCLLKKELEEIYPELSDDTVLYIYNFEYFDIE